MMNHQWNPARRRVPGPLVTLGLCLLLTAVSGPAVAAPPTLDAGTPVTSVAPDPMWTDLGDAAAAKSLAPTDRASLPATYRVAALDYTAMLGRLAQAPSEQAVKARDGLEITLPMPDGTYQRFAVVETRIIGKDVQQFVPDKRTYTAQGIDDPAAVIHFDTGIFGLRAYGRTSQGTLWIDPWRLDDQGVVISAWKHDFARPADAFECGAGGGQPDFELDALKAVPASGDQLHTFRLAVTLTGEYVVFFGGQAAAIDASITTINRVNSVYEIDAAVRFAYNYVVPYTDPATDPFGTGTTVNGTLLSQNQSVLDSLVGTAQYDIGHIFTQAGGGLAGLGVVCNDPFKGQGGTGLVNPVGDVFDIDYVAHEIGHQMGGNHTFNGSTGSCGGGNRSAANAYEPGSGSTIMAYAGICGAESVQPNSDAYFHVRSLEEIIAKRNASGCALTTATGNTPPTVDAGPDWTIPRSTTFYLNAVGSDADGDALTYNFEQYDLGSASPPTDPNGPLFRSYGPSGQNYRYFDNYSAFEVLPTIDRSLTMRAIVRDNAAGGGGVDDDEIELTVSGAPFAVTSPAGGESFTAGQNITVTWDVGGSVASDVKIYLFYDWNFVLLSGSTPNDGSEAVALPCGITQGNCRIWIEELTGSFAGVHVYDLSTGVFTLTDGLPDYRPVPNFAGWSGSVVPSPTATQTGSSVPAPTYLVGDATSYLAVAWGNYGSARTCSDDFLNSLRVDEIIRRDTGSEPAPGTGGVQLNIATTVSGGRHTVWQTNDPDNLIPETNETNNGYARQWVWEPTYLPVESIATRAQPPERTAGMSEIPGGTTFYQNMDGVALDDVGSGWQVIAANPLASMDYDVYLFAATTGPEDGFANPLTSSTWGGNLTDFVLINHNTLPVAAYDVGLLRYSGTGDYIVDRRYSADARPLGTAVPGIAFAENQLVDIQEIAIAPGQEGRNLIEIDNVSTAQEVQVYLFDAATGTAGSPAAVANTVVDGTGRAVIDFDFPAAGNWAIVLARRAADGLGAFTYDLTWRPTPPDIATAVLAGSHGPVVPQTGFPFVVGDPVTAPATLPGDEVTTNLYFHFGNNGPADAAPGWEVGINLDGVYLGGAPYPDVIPGGTTDVFSNVIGSVPVAGGRHTAGLFHDGSNLIDELYEDNNRYAEQWIWSPAQLALDGAVTRSGSPDPLGGWDDIPGGLIREPNADGLRTPAFAPVIDDGYLGGFAATPAPGSDVDLRVHAPSVGASDGFDVVLETASQAGGATELVLFDLDGLIPAGSAFDVGAVNAGGPGAYQAHATASQFLYYNADGPAGQSFGPFGIAPGQLLGLFEFYAGSALGGELPLSILVDNLAGNADLALAVFGRGDASGLITLPEAIAGGYADANGPGGDEQALLTIPAMGYWAVAVYKVDGNETAKDASFGLRFAHQSVVDVPDAAPLVAGISNHPNPFNPQTKLSFTLEKPGRATVRIYDVQGRLVRTVVESDLAAGRHERNWNGVDDSGNAVASGVYLARFAYPGGAMSQRMVLLK